MKPNLLLAIICLAGALGSVVPAAQPPQPPVWARKDGGLGFERPEGIAVDPLGNVALSGTFTNSGTFGTNVFPGSIELSGFISVYDRNGSNRWARAIGNSTGNRVQRVAFDPAGNVYGVGFFSGEVDFGGISRTSAGSNDLFVARYDPNGVLAWVFTGGGAERDEGRVVGLDAATNVYVAGLFRSTATFGTNFITSAGGQDLVAMKLDSAGNLQWVRRGGGTGTDEAARGTADAAGNFHVGGVMSGTATFGGNTLVSAGGIDVLVLKYNSEGNVIFAFRGGSSTVDNLNGLALDEHGNTYISGDYEAGAVFGTNFTDNLGGGDFFTAKLDTAGSLKWIKTGGGSANESGRGIITDSAGGVYVTGLYSQTVAFDDVTLTNAGGTDVPILKYDYEGNLLWALRMGGTAGDQGWNITADLLGNIYFCAEFRATAGFGTNTLISSGNADIAWGKIITAKPPQLDVMQAGTNAVIRWNILGSEFRVESSARFDSPTVWTNLPAAPSQMSLWNVVTNSMNPANQFFRLNWP